MAMRKKFISKTYLRDVSVYQLRLYYDDSKDYVVCAKKIEKVKSPFVTSNGITLIYNNYYILEITPLNENYNIRIYFNDKKEIVEYYLDITNGNGIDGESKLPYYDDLYLDVLILEGKTFTADEGELEKAYADGKITKAEYELAHKTANKLLYEIETKTNRYLNLDYNFYLNF